MKRLPLTSVAILALSAGTALAADLGTPPPAYKAPMPAPVVANWTGCYIDGGVGYGMWNQDHNLETSPGLASLGAETTSGGRGWLGRAGAGCDYEFASTFVIGVFGDYDFMNLHGTFGDPVSGLQGNENESGSWAVGGRVGYLVTPLLLTYVDGGYTQARFDQINLSTSAAPIAAVGSIAATTYDGWFLGGGTEYALNSISFIPIPGLYWRTEYRYGSYNSADLPVLTLTGVPTGTAEHVQKQVQTITSGIVWRFNFGGPLSTRY